MSALKKSCAAVFALIVLLQPLHAEEPPLGLSELEAPADNPMTEAKVALGKKLFFDKMLSSDGTVSCASCHDPEHAFADPGKTVSPGVGGKLGRRNSPSLLNVAYAKSLFLDGRAETLEDQAWQPILADDEMGNRSEREVLERLSASEEYTALFKEVFGKGPDKPGVAQALASFQRSLLSGNSAFDRWNWGGDDDALDEKALKGYELFAGQALCWQCHPLNGNGILLTDFDFHDTGVSELSAIRILTGNPKRKKDEILATDQGRFEVSKRPIDRWKYKTPSLRNVALTPPYMHDGSLKTLEEVLQFYNRGGGNATLSELNLSEEDLEAIIAFLHCLTGGEKPE